MKNFLSMTPEKANKMNEEKALERGNELAFPLSTGSGYPNTGMTKREYMVTQIITGLLSHGHDIDTAVKDAVYAVDKLLIELHVKHK